MYLHLLRQPPEGEWLRGKLYCLTSNSPKGDLTSMHYLGSPTQLCCGGESGGINRPSIERSGIDNAALLPNASAALFTCDTLERTTKAILPLIYPVQVTQSPKFKRLLPILCNVPSSPSEGGTRGSRLGIRIHVGTKPEHSSGCILVPNRQIEDQITQLLLQAQHEHEDIRLDISNFRPNYTDEPCPAHECAMRNRSLD